MLKRSPSIPVVVLIAVVALVLGSFGSATAAGITKGQVKKIAAKVVSKKASGLSVAKAATADTATTAGSATTATTATNATNLGGKTAAQLQTTAFKFSLPVEAPAPSQTYSFPGVPAGTYLATYNLTATMATPGNAPICQMRSTPASPSDATSYGGTFAGFARTESSGIIAVTPSTVLECNSSGGNFTLLGGTGTGSVSFVAVDALTSGGTAAASLAAVSSGSKNPAEAP